MDEQTKQFDEQGQLWRRYVEQAGAQAGPAELDPNLLAAYLDGRAEPGQVEEIEAHLADDPALLDQLLELRKIRGIKPAAVSPSLLGGAKSVVAAEAGPRPASGPFRQLTLNPWWIRLGHTAAAAAILLACMAGYGLGRSTFQGQRRAQATVNAGASLALEDLISEPTLGVMLNGDDGKGGER